MSQVNRLAMSTDDRQTPIYRVGERVDVTIRRAEITSVGFGAIEVELPATNGAATTIAIPVVDTPSVTVDRVTPGWWPPRPGQIVRITDGTTVEDWWVMTIHDELWLINADNRQVGADNAIRHVQQAGYTVELLDVPEAAEPAAADRGPCQVEPKQCYECETSGINCRAHQGGEDL